MITEIQEPDVFYVKAVCDICKNLTIEVWRENRKDAYVYLSSIGWLSFEDGAVSCDECARYATPLDTAPNI